MIPFVRSYGLPPKCEIQSRSCSNGSSALGRFPSFWSCLSSVLALPRISIAPFGFSVIFPDVIDRNRNPLIWEIWIAAWNIGNDRRIKLLGSFQKKLSVFSIEHRHSTTFPYAGFFESRLNNEFLRAAYSDTTFHAKAPRVWASLFRPGSHYPRTKFSMRLNVAANVGFLPATTLSRLVYK
jgi:hypothetical protein